MRRKKADKDPFDEYHKSALRQDLFGMVFAVAGAVIIVALLFTGIQHFAKG